MLPIGKKALEYFSSHGYQVLSNAYGEAADVSISDCFTLARRLCDGFLQGKFSQVRLAYTNFASILVQTPAVLPLLPLPVSPRRNEPAGPGRSRSMSPAVKHCFMPLYPSSWAGFCTVRCANLWPASWGPGAPPWMPPPGTPRR